MQALFDRLAQAITSHFPPTTSKPAKEVEVSPSSIWERYTKVGHLGSGISGQVDLARDNRSSSFVAIKQIRNALSTPDSAIQLLREVSILEELTNRGSPYVTHLLDFRVQDGTAFLVLEYGGVSLSSLLDQKNIKGSMDEIIALGLLKALDNLHRSNIIHRDIKPQNVLVDDRLNIKLCDFGLARSMPEDTPKLKDFNGRSKSRKEIGFRLVASRDECAKRKRNLSPRVVTRWYRAPEILLLEKTYNEAIDIWSAGCVIGEMLASTYGVCRKGSIIFKGKYSQALSPPSSRPQSRSSEQLRTILRTLGSMDKYDKAFISTREAFEYLQSAEKKEMDKIRFDLEFPETSRALTRVLDKSLQINPHLRWTAADLVKLISSSPASQGSTEPSSSEARCSTPSTPKQESSTKHKADRNTPSEASPPLPPPITFPFDAAGVYDYDGANSPRYGLEEYKEMINAVASRMQSKQAQYK